MKSREEKSKKNSRCISYRKDVDDITMHKKLCTQPRYFSVSTMAMNFVVQKFILRRIVEKKKETVFHQFGHDEHYI